MVAGYPILELHSWHHLPACCLQNVKRALTGPNRGCPGRGQQPQQCHPPPAIITTTTILDMEQIVTPTGTQNSDQLRPCTTALAPRDARLSRWLPNLGFGPMFVPSFSDLHAPPRSPHAGPPGLVSRPQRPSRRCCVRTCVVALVQHTVVPTAPERTICRHPADCGVVFVGELVSLLLAAARTRLCCLERGTHGGDGGGHARPLLLPAGMRVRRMGQSVLCPWLAVCPWPSTAVVSLVDHLVEEDPFSPPCPPILASQTWPLARNGE